MTPTGGPDFPRKWEPPFLTIVDADRMSSDV